jgi:hypothetical protein
MQNKETNKKAEPFVAWTVSRRPVTTSPHLGFMMDKVAVRQIFLKDLWFRLFSIIPYHLSVLVHLSIADAMSPQ